MYFPTNSLASFPILVFSSFKWCSNSPFNNSGGIVAARGSSSTSIAAADAAVEARRGAAEASESEAPEADGDDRRSSAVDGRFVDALAVDRAVEVDVGAGFLDFAAGRGGLKALVFLLAAVRSGGIVGTANKLEQAASHVSKK